MNRPLPIIPWGMAVAVVLVWLCPSSVCGQGFRWRRPIPPHPFRLSLSDAQFKMTLEGQRTTYSSRGGSEIVSDSLALRPTLQLGLTGSVYHPNFLNFDARVEGGAGWSSYSTKTSGLTNERDQNDTLQSYRVNVDLLRLKPYATSIFVGRGFTTSETDFFSRTEVDSFSYGLSTGYRAGWFPFYIFFNHSEYDTEGIAFFSTTRQDTAGFNMSHQRSPRSISNFNYTYSRSDSSTNGAPESSSTGHFFGLSDTETFGRTDWGRLFSNWNYSEVESSKSFNWTEELDLDHAPNLRSNYNYSLDRFRETVFKSDSQNFSAYLHHQLYASLASSFGVYVNSSDSESPLSKQENTGYGIRWGESYTKQLPKDARLSIGYNLTWGKQQRDVSGALILINNERVRLKDGEVTLLRLRGVDLSSIVVTNTTGNITYLRDVDYRVFPQGEHVQIERIFNGTIPDGTEVLVDYTATSQPSGEFTTVINQWNARLDLWNRRLSIYARYLTTSSSGTGLGTGFDREQAAIGVQSQWKKLSSGTEYSRFESDTSEFEAVRLYQSLSLRPNMRSSLGLNSSQSWSTFGTTGETRAYYSFIANYNVKITRYLLGNFSAGVRFNEGRNVDDRDFTMRSELKYNRSALNASLLYEFQSADTLYSSRERHKFVLQVTRRF